MGKFKKVISRFTSLIIKKYKSKDKNIEVDDFLSKEAQKKDTPVIKLQENNIKIIEKNDNFQKNCRFEVPQWNNEDINYFASNVSLNRYFLNEIDDYANEDHYYNFNKDIKVLALDCLDLFDEIEISYFEELERYERQLEGLVRFGYRTIEEIGLDGEISVQIELLLLDEDEYKVINNILIPSHNGETTQIDSIVISKYGVFVIETKKYSGMIVGDEKSKYWTCYYKEMSYNKKLKSNKIITRRLYNPIRQNLGHILSLKKLLNEFGDLKIYSIIAFDENAELKVNTVTEVIYIKNLVNKINKYKIEVIDENLVEEVYNKILKHKLDNDVYLKGHLEYLTNIKESELMDINNIKLDYLLTLCITPKIGTKTIELIKEMHKNIHASIHTVDDLLEMLNKCHSINSFITVPTKEILESYYQLSLKYIDNYITQGIVLTPYYDLDYPRSLIGNYDYPQIIFSKGDIRILNNSKKIGILVSHSPTKYGSSSAYRLGEICAINNLTLVSIIGEDYDLSVVNGALDNGGQIILLNPTRLQFNKANDRKEIYNKILKNKGCIISFSNDKHITSDYKIIRSNRNFKNIVNKLILVEPHLNDNIKKSIDEIYAGEIELAYVPQSKSNEKLGNVDPNEILMSKFNAIKLSDSETLNKFLS